jgi:hypothetical protein
VADENLSPDVGTEAVIAPPEAETGEQQANPESQSDEGNAAPNPVEALAVELGWAPRDQFRGDPELWKPADEFIRAGKDIQRNLSRDLKDLKSTVSNMSRTSATLLEQQLAERDAYWESRKREAVEAGDYAAVEHADQQRAQIKQQVPTTQAPTSEGQQFIERNSKWYGKDQEATAYAVSRADHYARQGLSAARQLAAVEQDMRGVFPDLFPPPAKQPPAVARPASRTASVSNRTKGFHDLPAEAQAVARDMVDRGVIPTTDHYVTNYFNQPERKVG